MLRLLKYEFRKRIATLSVVLAILLLTQGWALFCLCTKEHADQLVLPFTFLIIFGFLGTVFLFFDGVSTFSSEFSDKKGYMMFLTPNSPGAIVGAKFLYAVITVVGGYSLFHLFAYWDYSLFINKWENVKEGTYNVDVEMSDEGCQGNVWNEFRKCYPLWYGIWYNKNVNANCLWIFSGYHKYNSAG